MPGHHTAAESAIVDAATAAGGTVVLEHSLPDAQALRRLQGLTRASQKGLGHILTLNGQHPGLPVQDSLAVAADDLRWRARDRQPAGHLGTEWHGQPPRSQLDEPGDGTAPAIVASADAQQTGADEITVHSPNPLLRNPLRQESHLHLSL